MSYQAERQAREERARLIANTEPFIQRLQRGERLTVEERTSLDAQHAEIATLNQEIRSYEQARELSASMDAGSAPATGAENRDAAFTAWMRTGERSAVLAGTESRDGASVGAPTAGGYLVPPGWWQRLQVALKAYGGTAADFQTIETASGQPMDWATVDPTTYVGQLVGSSTTTGLNSQTPGLGVSGTSGVNENNQVGDVDYVFGQGVLNAYMGTSGVNKVSFQLANDSAFDIDGFVSTRVNESLGRMVALYAMSGSGVNAPLGIITALAAKSSAGTVNTGAISGIGGFVTLATAGATQMGASTASTELLSNTLNPSTLRSMIAAVDPAYRALGAKWYMNDNQLLGLRGQTDSNGRPLINLQDGLSEGMPTILWNYPITVDQNIPNLAASTTGGPIFGHLQAAMVKRTVTQSGLLRLDQRYADQLQIGYIGYMRFDVKSNDLRAAVTVRGAAT